MYTIVPIKTILVSFKVIFCSVDLVAGKGKFFLFFEAQKK